MAKIQEAIICPVIRQGVQENKDRSYWMIGMSNMGIMTTDNKGLQNNIQHVYDYIWKMAM